MRCIAVAPTQTGMLIFCPKTEADRSITDTSLSTRGYSFHLTEKQIKRIKSLHHRGYLQFLMGKSRSSCCQEKRGESCVGAGAEPHCVTQSCSRTHEMDKSRREQARKSMEGGKGKEPLNIIGWYHLEEKTGAAK